MRQRQRSVSQPSATIWCGEGGGRDVGGVDGAARGLLLGHCSRAAAEMKAAVDDEDYEENMEEIFD